jgi:hypothetical protein
VQCLPTQAFGGSLAELGENIVESKPHLPRVARPKVICMGHGEAAQVLGPTTSGKQISPGKFVLMTKLAELSRMDGLADVMISRTEVHDFLINSKNRPDSYYQTATNRAAGGSGRGCITCPLVHNIGRNHPPMIAG